MTPPAVLEELGVRIGAVSPAWHAVVEVRGDAAAWCDAELCGLEPGVARGIETIREGWLLHTGRSRVAPRAGSHLALLVGDWCYAAGLCDVIAHGSLEDVRVLADLIADVAARHEEQVDVLEQRWNDALDALRTSVGTPA